MRPDRKTIMMKHALIASERSTCNRAHVGCVIEKEGRILSTGYNGSPPGEPHCFDVGCLMENGHCIRTIHAEANAICFAARHGISLRGSTLYVTGWAGGSCHRCKMLIKAAGITEIVTDGASIPSITDTLRSS
jgi:dCMP deaminase